MRRVFMLLTITKRSAHLLWIGDRTRNLESGHVEFCSGIQNPIAIKIGPTSTPEGVVALVNKLNPHRIKAQETFLVVWFVDVFGRVV